MADKSTNCTVVKLLNKSLGIFEFQATQAFHGYLNGSQDKKEVASWVKEAVCIVRHGALFQHCLGTEIRNKQEIQQMVHVCIYIHEICLRF